MPAVGETHVTRIERVGEIERVEMLHLAAERWSQVLPLDMGRERTCLLAHDRERQEVEVLLWGGPEVTPERVVQPLTGDWTHLVTGRLYTTEAADLLLYHRVTGQVELHTIDAAGQITLLRRDALRRGYSHIVPGNFHGPDYQTDLFCYDSDHGVGDFYRIDESGEPDLVATQRVSRGCTKVIAGRFLPGSGLRSDLLFYDIFDAMGRTRIELFQIDQGRLIRRATSTSAIPFAHLILPGRFDPAGPPDRSDLLFYNWHSGNAQFWRVETDGSLKRLAEHYWEPGWRRVVAGNWVESPFTSLLVVRDR